VADIAIEPDMSIDMQVDISRIPALKCWCSIVRRRSRALAIRRAAERDWHPVLVLLNAASSIATRCGRRGWRMPWRISTSFLKDAAMRPKDDPAHQAWLAFMDNITRGRPGRCLRDVWLAAAETLFQC